MLSILIRDLPKGTWTVFSIRVASSDAGHVRTKNMCFPANIFMIELDHKGTLT